MASEPPPDEAPPVPKNAEDRKTAASLSKLEGRNDDDEQVKGKGVDSEALGQAMKNLDVKDDSASKPKEPEKKIKLDPADVTLLVSASAHGIALC
jgi:hypothetical protein